MTINNATVEQINVALLDLDKRIKALNIDNEAIKSLQNSIKTIKSSLNGTTTGMAKALTVNGKTYNGSEDVNAGVQTVENGGTGVTTQAEINKAFIGNLDIGDSDVTDGTEFVSSWANDNGFSEPEALDTPFRRKFSTVWNYIKDKISSVLGLTKDNYGGKAENANYLFYTHANEINFKGGAVDSCYFNYRNADTEGPSPVNAMNYIFCNYGGDTSKSVIKAGSFNGTADKAVEVVDYGDTLRTVRIGYHGSGVTADKLLHLAGYTEEDSSSVKLKDVSREEVIKWLGIPRIKYADYRTEELSFSSVTDQKKIELSNFGSNVTEENVLSFMVIYWTGVPIIASGDWAKSQGLGTSGLACQLHALNAGTGRCVIRCVYVV